MIVLDSSFLIAFHNKRDFHHAKACALMHRFLAGAWGQGLLLEYVYLEIVTVLLVRRDLSIATRIGCVLLDAAELEFVPCSDLFLETVEAFSTQAGSTQGGIRLSFTDAAIAGMARSRADGKILSFDEEFKKVSDLHINPD